MTLRGGVIGFGGMGYLHAEILERMPGFALSAVCDLDPATRTRAGERFPKAALYADVAKMLGEQALDLVCVATHANHHERLSLAACEAGAHVICEKPIATSLAEADAMIAACAARGRLLIVNHQWRLGAAVEAVHQALQRGEIGHLTSVIAHFGKGRPAGYELYEMGTHVFDIIAKLCGAPAACTAHISFEGRSATPADIKRGPELCPGGRDCGLTAGDAISASFLFPGGPIALVEGYGATKAKNPRIVIELRGSKGRLRIVGGDFAQAQRLESPFEGEEAEWTPFAAANWPEPDWLAAGPPCDARTSVKIRPIVPVYERLLAALASGEEHPCSGQGARIALEMIAAIFTAHFAGGPVPLPLAERTDPLRALVG